MLCCRCSSSRPPKPTCCPPRTTFEALLQPATPPRPPVPLALALLHHRHPPGPGWHQRHTFSSTACDTYVLASRSLLLQSISVMCCVSASACSRDMPSRSNRRACTQAAGRRQQVCALWEGASPAGGILKCAGLKEADRPGGALCSGPLGRANTLLHTPGACRLPCSARLPLLLHTAVQEQTLRRPAPACTAAPRPASHRHALPQPTKSSVSTSRLRSVAVWPAPAAA